VIDDTGTIRTTPGPHLLNEGDVIAFPQQGWAGQVTKVTDLGIRVEMAEWLLMDFSGGEILFSWDQVLDWPPGEFHIWGEGYYLDAALREVRYAGERRRAEEEQAKAGPSAPDGGQE
jgi:hypothetical protein